MIVVTVLVSGISASVFAATLERELEVGATGTDVSALQTFLAQDSTIYPQGLVTGYFGFLTKAAVSNFQSRNDIPTVGRVGPLTLRILNSQMSGPIVGSSGVAPTISNASISTGRNSVNLNWNTNEYASGVVYYSENPLILREQFNSVDVSGNFSTANAGSGTSLNAVISGLSSDTRYYYMVYVTDQTGNVSVMWPSTFQTTN